MSVNTNNNRVVLRVAKLLNPEGGRIWRPTAVEATIEWSITDGRAIAWEACGQKMYAELKNARVVSITICGIRIEGFEAYGSGENEKFRAMEWFASFRENEPQSASLWEELK